jgi:hypothetical protein
MALAHNLTSLVLSILAWIFFVLGCIGNSTSEDNVENAPWIIVNPEGSGNHIFFGTQAFYQRDSVIFTDDLTKYKNCSFDFCTPCKDNGRVTFALLVIAVCFATLAIIFSAILCGSEVVSLQYTNLAFTGSATVMAVVGWSVFMRRCYHQIDEVTNHLEYGAGASITLLGFLLMGIATAINAFNVAYPSTQSAAQRSAVPQEEAIEHLEAKPVE